MGVRKKVLESIERAKAKGATELDLSGKGLKELPAEIVQLTQLQRLDLSSNGLRELPAEIVQLTQLQRLDLAYNGLKELPAEIVQLTQLQKLAPRANRRSYTNT